MSVERASDLRGSFFCAAFLFNLFLVALQVLHHEILASEFEVVAEVVEALVVGKVLVVHNFVDEVALNPQDVPVVASENGLAAKP